MSKLHDRSKRKATLPICLLRFSSFNLSRLCSSQAIIELLTGISLANNLATICALPSSTIAKHQRHGDPGVWTSNVFGMVVGTIHQPSSYVFQLSGPYSPSDPGLGHSNKKLLGAPGIATRSILTTSNKKGELSDY